MYDLTEPKSFREVEDFWLQEAKNNSDSDVLICLVGNKCDLPSQILDEEINLFVQSAGLASYLVSAKTGEGVHEMFGDICQKLIKSARMRKPEKEEPKIG